MGKHGKKEAKICFCVYFKIVSYKSYLLVIKQYKTFTKLNHKCEIFF